MRCLVVAPAISPVVGGAETIAHVLASGLVRHGGMDVDLVVGNEPEPKLRSLLMERGSVHVVHGLGSVDNNVAWEAAIFSRAEAVFDLLTRADVVHAMSHDAAVSAAIALSGQGLSTPPLVATLSEMSPQTSAFGRARSHFVYSLPISGYVHLSNYYRSVAHELGARAVPEVVAAGVDEMFKTGNPTIGRRMCGAHPDEFVVVCPSRFTPRKGQIDLLEALELLAPDVRSGLRVVLGGSANSGSRVFQRQVQDLARNSSSTVSIMEVPRPRMPDMLAGADLVVLPSHVEGLGFAAIEAMLAGTPVVLTSVDGFDEVVNVDGQALMVPPKQPAALATAISAARRDPALRERLIRAGFSRATSEFGLHQFIDRVTDLYRRVCKLESVGQQRDVAI